MKLSKTFLISATLAAIFAAAPLYAADTKAVSLTSAEKSTLATIAAIDKNEILVSVVATNKKNSSGVTDFANMMIEQHGNNLTQILQMADKTPLSGGEAEKQSADGKKLMLSLGALQGAEFDTAYVNAMVQGHAGALNLIDTRLMKTAKSEEMKRFMTDTRAVVAEHLEHAKKLQEEMKS